MTARTVWCDHAVLPDGVADRVEITIGDDGRIATVSVGADPAPGSERRNGLTVAGAANAHGHAFHRALRHHSQRNRGSFWTWRDQMYGAARRLDPDRYHRLARAVFAEMVMAGYSAVGEFHYLHHQPDGSAYAEANAMGDALLVAAAEAGIRITLLDTVYLHGGLDADGYRPTTDGQRRFSDGSVDRWAERIAALAVPPRARLGAAIHSVRAVDPGAIDTVAAIARDRNLPLHAHVSEQQAENEACRDAFGATPVEVLADALGERFTAVHATHLSASDMASLGATGSTVCLCPTTERDLGDGVGQARLLLDAGATLAIGSDSHAVVDPFEEARAIELDERLVQQVRGVLTVDELLATLTAGHRCLGWDDAGSIGPGRRADLVTIDLDSVRLAGATAGPGAVGPGAGGGDQEVGALAEALIFAASPADITDVTIDGVDLVSGGRHHSIDVAAELTSAIGELWR